MSTAEKIAGRIYPAKSAKLELIDLLQEQLCAPYQTPGDRASITRTILSRVVDDLKHGVQILDALQDERDKNFRLEQGQGITLQKGPVAFRVPQKDGWAILQNEQAAQAEAEQMGVEYQGLYARTFNEQSCPGHVASKADPKVCGRCGTHIDSLRPDNAA